MPDSTNSTNSEPQHSDPVTWQEFDDKKKKKTKKKNLMTEHVNIGQGIKWLGDK